jgi:signal transduction histidine kinase
MPSRRPVAALRTSGEALLALVDDILDFAKVEAGKLELVAEPFDPAQLVETVAELMAPRAQAKGIELAAHIAPDLPARLVGDRPAAPDTAEPRRQRGEVHGSRRCRPEPGPNRDRLEITVADTGPGIPSDRLDMIFGEFEQLDHGSAQVRPAPRPRDRAPSRPPDGWRGSGRKPAR